MKKWLYIGILLAKSMVYGMHEVSTDLNSFDLSYIPVEGTLHLKNTHISFWPKNEYADDIHNPFSIILCSFELSTETVTTSGQLPKKDTRQLQDPNCHSKITALDISQLPHYILAGREDGNCTLFDLKSNSITTERCTTEQIVAVCFDEDNHVVAFTNTHCFQMPKYPHKPHKEKEHLIPCINNSDTKHYIAFMNGNLTTYQKKIKSLFNQ